MIEFVRRRLPECGSGGCFPAVDEFVWVVNVSEKPVHGNSHAVMAANRQERARVFSRAEAEALLPKIHSTVPNAKIIQLKEPQ